MAQKAEFAFVNEHFFLTSEAISQDFRKKPI